MKLTDICSRITSGGTPKSSNSDYYGGDIPWLRTQEINFVDIENTENHITEAGLTNSSAKWIPANSVIVAMYGATAGKVAINKIPLTTNQACCNLIIDGTKADYRYVYYQLRLNYQQLAGLANGGAQQNLNARIISEYDIPIPPLSVQKEIADTLSSLDEKIANNSEVNHHLQEMVYQICRSWFIDFEPWNGEMPPTWQSVTLGDICAVVTKGTTPTTLKKQFVVQGINFIKAESILDDHSLDFGKLAFIDDETHSLLSRSAIQDGDIIFTIAGTLGRFALVGTDMLPANTNQAVAIIRADKSRMDPITLYSLFIGGLHSDFYAKNVQQAVQANLSLTTIKTLPLNLPPVEDLSAYSATITPLVERILQNYKESRFLAALRDALLPRLMSGELSVVSFGEIK